MLVGDWDTKANRQYKDRMQALSQRQSDVLYSLDIDERDSYLKMCDQQLEWTKRCDAGRKLATATLQAEAAGQDYHSIAKVVLGERGL